MKKHTISKRLFLSHRQFGGRAWLESRAQVQPSYSRTALTLVEHGHRSTKSSAVATSAARCW